MQKKSEHREHRAHRENQQRSIFCGRFSETPLQFENNSDFNYFVESTESTEKNLSFLKEMWNFTSILDSATSNFTYLYVIPEKFCPEKT